MNTQRAAGSRTNGLAAALADRLVRGLYTLFTWGALPGVLAYFFWRGRREPAYRQHWRERLGQVRGVPTGAIWVHAASVGEAVLVTPLIQRLQRDHAQRAILVTTMTPTGRAHIERVFADTVYCRYVPLDTRGATRRFMRATRPGLAVIAETELWPNLLAAARCYAVPVALVNASISSRSASRYRFALWRATVADMLASLAAIGAASHAHAQRFVALGARADRTHAIGNLKYDTVAAGADDVGARDLRDAWHAGQRPIWVAASTHEGEEARVLDAWASLRERFPSLLLVIAPRHPQRFEAVAELLSARGHGFARRSSQQPVTPDTEIVLADTLGEVPLFYAAADVALVGGSLVPGIEGHNVLEAAAQACPLCVGPYVREWRDIVDALAAVGAARVCDTPAQLTVALAAWLADPAQARAAGEAGRRLVRERAGALDHTVKMLESFAGNLS
ncbi:3-deoxy-D-manno-octulosonic-acid transferase domain-containing protein [Salinisphaera sp. T5B8]|uniref:3-deoxy-D-manno-octulosonic acid transferase n=1 Tax=Salinisphaera sp. T5B8 TaxID=1304154 RepID=UPI00333F45D9